MKTILLTMTLTLLTVSAAANYYALKGFYIAQAVEVHDYSETDQEAFNRKIAQVDASAGWVKGSK